MPNCCRFLAVGFETSFKAEVQCNFKGGAAIWHWCVTLIIFYPNKYLLWKGEIWINWSKNCFLVPFGNSCQVTGLNILRKKKNPMTLAKLFAHCALLAMFYTCWGCLLFWHIKIHFYSNFSFCRLFLSWNNMNSFGNVTLRFIWFFWGKPMPKM